MAGRDALKPRCEPIAGFIQRRFIAEESQPCPLGQYHEHASPVLSLTVCLGFIAPSFRGRSAGSIGRSGHPRWMGGASRSNGDRDVVGIRGFGNPCQGSATALGRIILVGVCACAGNVNVPRSGEVVITSQSVRLPIDRGGWT
ncbi:MAG: hypothetical protein JW384_00866 [Nitrosomonadaceae bacterium]|nr:hypothetical protein [Nitrosomonadaceae bacterium]